MWMCTARKRVKDVPISAQGSPAVLLEGLPAVIMEGMPTVLFIRRFCGGLADLSAGSVADLTPLKSA